VADLRGPSRLRPRPPLGRRTDAVTVLLISENGSVLWRRHLQFIYKQVTVTHHSLSLSSKTASKDDRKSQALNSASSWPEGVNAKNVNEPVPIHFTYLHYVSTEADEWPNGDNVAFLSPSLQLMDGCSPDWIVDVSTGGYRGACPTPGSPR